MQKQKDAPAHTARAVRIETLQTEISCRSGSPSKAHVRPGRPVVFRFQAEAGGERPLLLTARSALSEIGAKAAVDPASRSTAAPGVESASALDPTGLDVQEVQCCGVLRWQMRS